MNIIAITDPQDVRLEPYRDLKRQVLHRRPPWFIAEGKLVVQRLLASSYETISVLAEPGRTAWLQGRVAPQLPVLVVSPELIRQVAGFDFHRGVLACARRPPVTPAEELFQSAPPTAIALAAIAIGDLENLGSLIRSAAAMGVDRLALSPQTADPLNRRVLRVSMGAALKMRYFDLAEPLAWLEENARRAAWLTIATTLANDSISMSEVTLLADLPSRRRMIVLGNEADGLPATIQAACAVRAKIPMVPGIDSLNVAVAGAIAIYELVRASPSAPPPRDACAGNRPPN